MMKILKTFFPLFVALFTIVSFTLLGCGAEGIKVLDSKYKAVILAEDTPLSGVNGAAIGADGALYVVHTGNSVVTRVDLKTMKATTFVPSYGGVYICDDICADDKGNLYVTGTTPAVGEVYRIDQNGVKTVIADGFLAPNGIEYNKKTGRLFMTECFQGNRVYELDPEGKKPPRLIIKENVIPVPEGFGIDPDTDDLIIPDLGTGKILRVHPDTGKITVIAEKFIAPVALTIGPDKMAYIVSLFSGVVSRLSLDGKKREDIAKIEPGPGLDNLAMTDDGRLFVTSYWDATIYEVSTDGSGKYKRLFAMGPNQLNGIAVKGDKIFVSDAIMIRQLKDGKYEKTKLNAWATHGMPLTIGLTDGPGDLLFWPDFVNGAVGFGNPDTGKFQPIAGGLKRPMAVLVSGDGSKIYVAEYAGNQITEVSLKDGAKKVLAAGLEGPLALAMIDNMLYVAEAKPGRISKVDPATGKKEVFISGAVGKVCALANDGEGNLLAFDGASQKILRISIKNLAISIIAENVPNGYFLMGSYPPVEFPAVMTVSAKGDIYLTTANRGVIKLEK
jgi:sugar lactone lactonase YvrE